MGMKVSGTSWSRRGGRPSEEPRVFTEYVRALGAGEPLDSGLVRDLLGALRSALRNELKRRGLWESPPSFLGIYGWEKWESTAFDQESALEELVAECYTYIFVSRLRALQAQLKSKPNIDGLVFLNVRHFLHERQKEHDPLGSQVFEVLQSAVRLAVEQGELRVLEGDERIRNDTVLGFGPEGDATQPPRDRIAALVRSWNDKLLPDLVTLRGRRQEEVVERLRGRLPDLHREGIAVVRFKDLVDPLKADVRARWTELLHRAQGELAPQGEGEGAREVVRLSPPDTRVEERQFFRKLVDCVLTGLRRLDVNEKTRGYLATLWQFLRIQASEGAEERGPASRLDSALKADLEAEDREQPSQRKLAELLGIPRERLPGLYTTLGELLEWCRAAISSKTTVKSSEGDSALRSRRGRRDGH